ncbi:RNA recognition motif 1 in plant MEI2-like protein [Heracleum sosnowskyi]|uniref:RNA recognition motif 1 in plant MEI2-like protein n=1 Tax=Heracleum sosnowskyi TaxID=360622 RepID=A0AAD8HFC6_9APIA|nr:RNA recognition motif 1 in plant MEI2-like protein [Heracleum sosnowskyi]
MHDIFEFDVNIHVVPWWYNRRKKRGWLTCNVGKNQRVSRNRREKKKKKKEEKRQIGFWKTESMPENHVSPGLKGQGMLQTAGSNLHASSPLDYRMFVDSSLVTLSPSDTHNGRFVSATSNYDEAEPFESIEEIEAQTIGNLLPNDDDLLLGVTDGFDYITRPSGGDNIEVLDFFSSVGGLDLGEEQTSFDISTGMLGGSSGSIAGEHPSRTLFVRNINSNVEDIELQAIFAQYGDIRTLYTACKHRGFVMISYYDLRAAQNAMKALQNKPLRRRKLDIHFSIPKDNTSEKDSNQGTLAVSKLDFDVTNDELRQLFGIYGDIKEIRDVPHRCHYKLIEFYDARSAEAALCALNSSQLAGKLDLRHPDGNKSFMQSFSEFKQDEYSPYLQQSTSHNFTTGFSGPASHGQITTFSMDNSDVLGANYSTGVPFSQYQDIAFQRGISSRVPSNLSSVIGAEVLGNQSSFMGSSHLFNKKSLESPSALNYHPHSLPDYHDDSVFLSTGNESYAPPALPQYMWNNSPKPHGMTWSNSPSYVNGICSPQHLQRLHTFHRPPYHMLSTNLPINSHQAGSAPSVDRSHGDRRHVYAGESPDTSSFQPGFLGNMGITRNPLHPLELVSPNIFPGFGGNCLDLPIASKVLQSPQQSSMMYLSNSQMYPRISPFDSSRERLKGRRNEGLSSQADNKKQYELDIDRIIRGEDKRTTLMLKNIPNKYTSKMLLAAIDEHHRGTYDFIYLPIDFKNKCNVGYAFINMTDPSLIIPFFQAFNGKKWEKFNSEKVASLAYARIQGKASLIAHFQNSSLMNEDKRCRPILFNTEGPNAGDQVPFPMGINVRSKSTKNQTGMNDEYHSESSAYTSTGEEYLSGDSSSRSSRDAAD